MASFGPIAPHYDVLMASVPYKMWVSYFLMLLARADQNPKTILDVCCGTGTVAELLAKQGYRLTGIDLSEPMIVSARNKAEQQRLQIDYHVADATNFNLAKTFDSAFSFFDSLNYIASSEGYRSAILSIGRHVKKGGSFVFDLNTAYAFEQRMFDQKENSKSAPLRYKWKGDYDPKSRIIEVVMDFRFEGTEFREIHVQRAHPDSETREFLAEAGFTDVTIYNSYTHDPPSKTSDRVHYVCTKG